MPMMDVRTLADGSWYESFQHEQILICLQGRGGSSRPTLHGISSPQRHPCQIPLQSSPDLIWSFPGFIGSIDRLRSDTKSGLGAVFTTETGEVRAHRAADRTKDEHDGGTRRRSHRAAVIWAVACLRTRESCSNVREQGMGHNDMGRRGANEA